MKGIIVADIGNSSITLGYFKDYELAGKERLKTLKSLTADDYRNRLGSTLSAFKIERLDGVIISSVVPELTETISSALSRLTDHRPLILCQSIESGLSFDIPRPEEVGHDRIASVVGARRLYGEPAIVVDFGTATTLSIVKDNTFIGGMIMPGLETMAKALNAYTSRLPLVDLLTADKEVPIPGKDTRENIISGIIYGTAGAVERMIEEVESVKGSGFKTVLTGGFSVIMAQFIKRDFFLDPDLTLKGLRFIYDTYTPT